MQLDDRVDLAPGGAELVHVEVADPAPVAEIDPELEAALGRLDEFALVDPQEAVELLERRDRRLAHPDDADRLAFDKP